MATTKDGTNGDLELEDEGHKPFANVLVGVEGGQFHADITREEGLLLRQLRDVAQIRGKAKGEIVLTFGYAVDDDDVVSIASTFKIKVPATPRSKTTMWVTPGGNLSPANPKQLEFGALRPVPGPAMRETPAESRPGMKGDRT